MDNLSVEVIGIILSCLEDATDVVRASCTCRKWRNAFRDCLCSLKFHFNASLAYFDSDSEIFTFITTTILQTNGLQELSITIDSGDEDLSPYPASTVTNWLVYVRETLKSLHFGVGTDPDICILDIYGKQKLEKLVVYYNTIKGVKPKYHLLPCLTSLSLNYLYISSVDFQLLLTACPKIETLSLSTVDIMSRGGQETLELESSSLKAIYVEYVTLDEFILKADSLEKLHLNLCDIEKFNFIGKGRLKHFELESVDLRDGGSKIDLGEVDLEIINVSNCEFSWCNFYKMISRSSNLRVLRLWHRNMDKVVYLEAISKSFPYLTKFSFICDVRENWPSFIEEGSYQFQNLVVLEVGWTKIREQFYPFLESFLGKCPNLKKLNIHGKVSNTKTPEECQILADLTSSMIQLMRNYTHVDVHFKYK